MNYDICCSRVGEIQSSKVSMKIDGEKYSMEMVAFGENLNFKFLTSKMESDIDMSRNRRAASKSQAKVIFNRAVESFIKNPNIKVIDGCYETIDRISMI